MLRYDKQIPVNPEVFRWLRESSGWTYGDISDKLEVSVNQVEDWERGKKSPTIDNLKVLAKEYKRPLAAFLLPDPGEKQTLPTDYRKLPDGSYSLSKKSLFAIRKARNMQTESGELMENLRQNVEPDVEFVSLKDDPELVSSNEREKMNITLEVQRKWRSPYDAFNSLREIIEHQNILVFQLSADLDDFRGFTLRILNHLLLLLIPRTLFRHAYFHFFMNMPIFC
jgi:transcriptional regulator with XRE-family HTH domain